MDQYNNIYYFDHIIGLRYDRWSTTSLPTATCTSQGQTIGNIDHDVNYIQRRKERRQGEKKGKGKKGKGKGYNNNYYNYQPLQQLLQPTTATTKGKSKGKGPIGSYDNNKGKNNQKGDKNNKGKGSLHRRPRPQSVGCCGKLGHRAASCWFNNQKSVNNIQQQQLPPQHQQFQLQGTSDQPISYMPPEGINYGQSSHNFQQSQPQQQPHQVHYQPVRQALPSTTSASSTTRVSTPGPTIYDISAINTEDISEGEQPPGIGNNRHLFSINQLNREHLRGLPQGLLHRWGILCDTGAVTSVAPRNFADHVPLPPHYTQLALSLQQPIYLFTSMPFYGYKDILPRVQQHQLLSAVPHPAMSKPHCWDYHPNGKGCYFNLGEIISASASVM